MPILIFLALTLGTSLSLAATPSLLHSQASGHFLTAPPMTLTRLGLGPLCSVLTSFQHELPCHPAFLPLSPKRSMAASLYAGDDYQTMYRNSELLSGDDKVTLLRKLLDEPESLRLDAAASFWFRSDWLGLAFVPYHFTYFSYLQNQAYPEVFLHAMQERTLIAQLGTETLEDLYAGVQFRLVERKFINENFFLLDAVADQESYLVVNEQKALYVEPGIHWRIKTDWEPSLSVFVQNLGWVDKRFEESKPNPVTDMGLRVSPPVTYGTWEIGFAHRMSSFEDHTWRLGTTYQYGLVGAFAAWDPKDWSTGINSSLRSLNVATMYRQRTFIVYGVHEDDKAVYVEFRVNL